MRLDLADVNIQASIKAAAGRRIRLTIEYPEEPRYRDIVLGALSEMLRPPTSPQHLGSPSTPEAGV